MMIKDTHAQVLPLVGILGDGQLSMMMAQAYQGLGGQVHIFANASDGPASAFAEHVFIGETDNLASLEEFFNTVDVVTLENEFIDSKLLGDASSRSATPMFPDPNRFGLIEDKLSEKRFYQALGIEVAQFKEVISSADLDHTPGYLKLAKGGYDGIGTYRVNNRQEAIDVFGQISSAGTVLFETAIPFKKELSLIAVAGLNETVFYPLVETKQESGTCRYVNFPAGISQEVEKSAQQQVRHIMDSLNTRGVFAFEYFLTEDDQLILNESAPRPHNSGHITLDLADCSQFENHMRAVAGLDVKTPKLAFDSMLMVNLLGTQNGRFNAEAVTQAVDDAQASLVLYRKVESRLKRKMGHVNVWGQDMQKRAEALVNSLII